MSDVTAGRENGRRRPRGYADWRPQAKTSPAKATDTRSAKWNGETCRAEALPPDVVLAAIVRRAIERHLDADVLDEHEDAERLERVQVLRTLPAGEESMSASGRHLHLVETPSPQPRPVQMNFGCLSAAERGAETDELKPIGNVLADELERIAARLRARGSIG